VVQVEQLDDRDDFDELLVALEVLEMSAEYQSGTFDVVGGILHLGNIQYAQQDDGVGEATTVVAAESAGTLDAVAALLGLDRAQTERSLVSRNIGAYVLVSRNIGACHSAVRVRSGLAQVECVLSSRNVGNGSSNGRRP
jgi:myosin heavy subunit